MVDYTNKTRKLKGGMFSKAAMLAKTVLTRGAPTAQATATRGLASATRGLASAALAQRSYPVLIAKDDFIKQMGLVATEAKPMTSQEFSKLFNRVRPISFPGIYKEYFKDKKIPNSLTQQDLKQDLLQYFEERGLVQKTKPKENNVKVNENEMVNEDNDKTTQNENLTVISKGKAGEKVTKANASSTVSSAFQYVKDGEISKTLEKEIQRDRAEIIMEDRSTLAKTILSYQPISDFALLLAERPGIRKLVKKTYVASRMTISKRNLPHIRLGNFVPHASDIKDINRIIVREVYKKLDLNPKFDVKSFMKTFDTETLVELKIALSSHYLVHGEKSTRILLKTFVDCTEEGLITKEVLRKFLNDFLHDSEDGLTYLKEILKESAKKSLELKRTRKQQFVKAIGWFGGRMLWSVVALSGAATLLLFLGWAGVKSGIPIVDNVFFKLFFRMEGSPLGAVDNVAALIKQKLEEGVEESEVMSKLVFDLLQSTYGEDLENVKGPMKEVAEKLKKKYLETTKPYRKQTFLEWLTSSKS